MPWNIFSNAPVQQNRTKNFVCIYSLARNVGYFSAGGNIMQTILQFEQFFLHAWLETDEEKE